MHLNRVGAMQKVWIRLLRLVNKGMDQHSMQQREPPTSVCAWKCIISASVARAVLLRIKIADGTDTEGKNATLTQRERIIHNSDTNSLSRGQCKSSRAARSTESTAGRDSRPTPPASIPHRHSRRHHHRLKPVTGINARKKLGNICASNQAK